MTSQDTGATGGSGLIVVTRPAGRGLVGSLGWCLACTARGAGATGQGSGVLHRGGVLVQYTQPLISTPPPSCSRPARGGAGPGAGVESVPSGPCAGARRGQTREMGPDLGGGARIPLQGSWARSRARPGVHAVDVNSLRCRYARRGSLEFCGLFSACDACAVLKSAVWTPTTYQYDLPSLFHRLAIASGRPAPSRGPVRASVSEVMTLACLRSEETRRYRSSAPQG